MGAETAYLTIMICSILAVTLMAILTMSYIDRELEHSVTAGARMIVEKCKKNIQAFLEDLKRISDNTTYQESVQQLMTLSPLERTTQVDLRDQARSVLIHATLLKESISGIQLFDAKGNLVVESGGTLVNKDYEQMVASPVQDYAFSRMYFTSPNPSWTNAKPPFFYLYVPVRSVQPENLGETVGTLAFCLMPKGDISGTLADVTPSTNAAILLLDNEGYIIASAGQNSVTQNNPVHLEEKDLAQAEPSPIASTKCWTDLT